MVAVRRLVALVLLGVLAAALAGPANAARPVGYPETMTTAHFQIHYTGGLADHAVTHQKAADIATLAEQAYATIVTGWGYPAPQSDGDGRADIWVMDLSATPGLIGYAEQDTPTNQSSGWISLHYPAADSPETIAHELTHLIQFGLWVPADAWMLESTAEWAGLAANGHKPFSGSLVDSLGAPDMSLDCTSAACGSAYETAGYTRWEFFQYLTERFGVGIVRDTFARGAALADPALKGVDLLDSALALKGTSLASVYGDFTFVQVAGSYQAAGLSGVPPLPFKSLPTGSSTVALPVQQIPVNHLATRYLRLTRGDGSGGPCYAATLSLTVSLPAGIASRPSFYSKTTGVVGLTVNGGTASAAIPWDTCTGAAAGYIALPNPSLSLDAQLFVVSGSITVDPNTVATPIGAPNPIYVGPTIAAPGVIAPSIHVYGAQVVRVSAASRLVRVIVFSSGDGKLRAAVGKTELGTFKLRPGNNDIRFRIPVKAVRALRSTASVRASSSVLTLTSLSTAGEKGKTVTRRLMVAKATRR